MLARGGGSRTPEELEDSGDERAMCEQRCPSVMFDVGQDYIGASHNPAGTLCDQYLPGRYMGAIGRLNHEETI